MGLLCFSHPKHVRMCFLEFLNSFCVNLVLTLETETFKSFVSQGVNQAYVGTMYDVTTQGILQRR